MDCVHPQYFGVSHVAMALARGSLEKEMTPVTGTMLGGRVG